MIEFNYAAGATPLDPDEIAGLIPPHITTHGQLNEWEEVNIIKAENWLASTSATKNLLSIDFIRLLHKKMFNDTWRWAGTFRSSAKNIGVDQSNITTELTKLLGDVTYQLEKNSYPKDEIAYRFHHRLVFIHPFPNGNGRHARIMTDLLLLQNSQLRFTWGNQHLGAQTITRKEYINALRAADRHDYAALAQFVRS